MGFKAVFGLFSTLTAQMLTRDGYAPSLDSEGASHVVFTAVRPRTFNSGSSEALNYGSGSSSAFRVPASGVNAPRATVIG